MTQCVSAILIHLSEGMKLGCCRQANKVAVCVCVCPCVSKLITFRNIYRIILSDVHRHQRPCLNTYLLYYLTRSDHQCVVYRTLKHFFSPYMRQRSEPSCVFHMATDGHWGGWRRSLSHHPGLNNTHNQGSFQITNNIYPGSQGWAYQSNCRLQWEETAALKRHPRYISNMCAYVCKHNGRHVRYL